MSDLGNKEVIAKNIKFYMDKFNKDRNQICDDLGFKYSTFSEWVNGNKYPRIDKIEILANYFGVQKSDLIEDKKDITLKEPFITYDKMINLPIVGKISCGNGVVAYEEIESYEPTPADWLNGGEYFYYRAKGDSMINARIHDGDLVLIRKQPDVDDGEIAAVLIDEDLYLKRVYKRNDSIILQSENPLYPPIIHGRNDCNQCAIIGKLKKIIINA